MIFTLATLVLGGAGNPPTTPVEKLDAMIRAKAGFAVEYRMKDSRFPGTLKGKFRMKYPDAFHAQISGTDVNYENISTPTMSIEMEHGEKIYYEWRSEGRYGPPAQRVSEIPAIGLPMMFLTGSLEAFAREKLKKAAAGETIEGTATEKFTAETPGVKVEAWISAEGKLIRLKRTVNDGGASFNGTWDFSNYRVPAPNQPYITEPPLGYAVIGTPRENFSVQVDEKFPTTGWPQSTVLNFRRPTLVVAVSANCPNSKALLKEMQAMNGTLPIYLVSDQMISGWSGPATRVVKADLAVQDRQLRLPGWPYTYLVDESGKVFWATFGFDRDNPKKWGEEVRAALKAHQTPRG